MKEDIVARCQEILDYRFADPTLLQLALTHPSCALDTGESYERLEFLGDAVLGLRVCATLYSEYEQLSEGEMTKIKSSVVSRKTCAEISRSTGLSDLLFLGNDLPPGRDLPESVAAAVFESVIGALYLDGGLAAAGEYVDRHTLPLIAEIMDGLHIGNYKSLLQQHAQRERLPTPEYLLLDEKGPDHSKCFEIAVSLGGRHFPSAWGLNKKDAEQDAARLALMELGVIDDEEPVDEA